MGRGLTMELTTQFLGAQKAWRSGNATRSSLLLLFHYSHQLSVVVTQDAADVHGWPGEDDTGFRFTEMSECENYKMNAFSFCFNMACSSRKCSIESKPA